MFNILLVHFFFFHGRFFHSVDFLIPRIIIISFIDFLSSSNCSIDQYIHDIYWHVFYESQPLKPLPVSYFKITKYCCKNWHPMEYKGFNWHGPQITYKIASRNQLSEILSQLGVQYVLGYHKGPSLGHSCLLLWWMIFPTLLLRVTLWCTQMILYCFIVQNT